MNGKCTASLMQWVDIAITACPCLIWDTVNVRGGTLDKNIPSWVHSPWSEAEMPSYHWPANFIGATVACCLTQQKLQKPRRLWPRTLPGSGQGGVIIDPPPREQKEHQTEWLVCGTRVSFLGRAFLSQLTSFLRFWSSDHFYDGRC